MRRCQSAWTHSNARSVVVSENAADTSSKDVHHGDLRKAARGTALNLAGAVVAAVATFGLTVVVTRGLSRADAGVFFSATSIFVIATAVGQLGTDTGMVYFVSRARSFDRLDAYMRAALRPVLVCGVVLAGAIIVLAPQIARITSPGHEVVAEHSLRVLAVFIPLAGLENVSLSASRGLGTMRAYTVVDQLIRTTLQFALAAIMIATGIALSLSWSWAIPYGVAAAIAWWWWRRLRSRIGAATQTTDRRSREFWRFTAPRSVASVAQLAMQRLDIVLVGALAGLPAAAIYTGATRFVVLGQLARNAVSLAVQPQLAGALAAGPRSRVHRLYQTSTAWLMGVTWPIYLVLLVDGPILLRVFGRGYEAGASVMILLAVAMLVATLCGDVDIMIIMAGRTTWSLANTVLAFAVMLGLDLWLIPLHGILGAAFGWSAAIIFKNLLGLAQVAIIFKVLPFGKATGLVAALSLAWFGVGAAVSRWIFGETLAGLVVGGVVSSVGYVACVWGNRRALALDSLVGRTGSGSKTARGATDVAPSESTHGGK